MKASPLPDSRLFVSAGTRDLARIESRSYVRELVSVQRTLIPADSDAQRIPINMFYLDLRLRRRRIKRSKDLGKVMLFIAFAVTCCGEKRTLVGTKTGFCYKEWKGDLGSNLNHQDCAYHIVLSHCRADISWLLHETRQTPCLLKSITIYSKCNTKIELDELQPFEVKIHKLPNVGRCDHTYSHHALVTQQLTELDSGDVIVFLKDTKEVHQPAIIRPMSDMVAMARGPAKFSCGNIPFARTGFQFSDISFWHSTKTLLKFRLNSHAHNIYKPMVNESFPFPGGDFTKWMQIAGIELPKAVIVPVCYGGNFATQGSQIKRWPVDFWRRIRESLSRGDNIEEGHFMERLWAQLLMQPLTQYIEEEVLSHARDVIETEYRGLIGTLYGCT